MNPNGQMIAPSFCDTHDGDNEKSSGSSHLSDILATRALGETSARAEFFFLSATAGN